MWIVPGMPACGLQKDFLHFRQPQQKRLPVETAEAGAKQSLQSLTAVCQEPDCPPFGTARQRAGRPAYSMAIPEQSTGNPSSGGGRSEGNTSR